MAVTLTCRVLPTDPALLQLAAVAAGASGRPLRPLHLQALLQLPRLADKRGDVPIQLAEPLIAELAAELPPEGAWFVPDAGRSPRSLRFYAATVSEVHDEMKRFHYLRSPRLDGRAYCLSTAGGDLVAFCVSSPLDVMHLGALLAAKGRPQGPETRVVSRVFAFEGAPRNTVSHLLSHAGQAEQRYGVTDLVTYVNPNMGFTGSSYRASGWHRFGDELTQYRYLNGRYITDRALAAAFGRQSDGSYKRLLGSRFAVAVMTMEPLLVFHRQLA